MSVFGRMEISEQSISSKNGAVVPFKHQEPTASPEPHEELSQPSEPVSEYAILENDMASVDQEDLIEESITDDLKAAGIIPGKRKTVSPKTAEASANPATLKEICKRFNDQKDMLVGVDISNERVSLCEMRFTGKEWKLKTLVSSVALNKTDSERAAALADLIKTHKIKTKEAAIAIPVDEAIVKTIELPLMEDADIEAAIELGSFWENFVQLADDLKHYSIHYEVIRRQEEKLSMDVLFVAAKHSTIKRYTDIASKAGLKPVVVDVRCFSVVNAVQLTGKAPIDEAIGFVKFDLQDQFIYISDHGKPYVYELFISDQDKSNLFEKVGDHEFVKRLASQVKQIISTHESTRGGEKRGEWSIRMLHSTSFSKGLCRMLKTLVSCYEVELLDMADSIALPKPMAAPERTQHMRGSSVVMGLAMRKLDIYDKHKGKLGRDNVNLIPHVSRLKKVSQVNLKSRMALGVSTAAVIAMVAGVTLYFQTTNAGYQAEIKGLIPVDTEHQRLTAEVNRLSGVVTKMEELQAVGQGLTPNQLEVLGAYNVIYENIPYGMWLTDINYNQTNEFSIAGNSVADQHILEFIRILSTTDVFDNVTLKTMQTEAVTESGAIKAFALTAKLGGE